MKIAILNPTQAPATTPPVTTAPVGDESWQDIKHQADRIASELPIISILRDKMSKGKKFDDIWKSYKPYSPGAPIKAGNAEELRKDLDIAPDWAGAPQLKRLVDAMDKLKLAHPTELTNME